MNILETKQRTLLKIFPPEQGWVIELLSNKLDDQLVRIQEFLVAKNIPHRFEPTRGFDHLQKITFKPPENWDESEEDGKPPKDTLGEVLDKTARSKFWRLDWGGLLKIDCQGRTHAYARVLVSDLPHRSYIDALSFIIYQKENQTHVEAFNKEWQTWDILTRRKRNEILLYTKYPSWIPRPKIALDDVILPEDFKADLLGHIEGFFSAEPLYQKFGLPFKRGLLLVGPPGNGKTHFMKAVAGEMKVPFIYALSPDLIRGSVRDWFDDVFAEARQLAPCILLIEDLEKILNSAGCDAMQYFLNLLDGFQDINGVLLVATSNEPERIDLALVNRPSRFDRVLVFSHPDPELKYRLLVRLAKGHFSEEAMRRCAQESTGFSMAYVKELVLSTFLAAVYRDVEPSDDLLLEMLAELKKQAGLVKRHFEERRELGFAPQERSDAAVAIQAKRPLLPRRSRPDDKGGGNVPR